MRDIHASHIVEEYLGEHTINPDVLFNSRINFGMILHIAIIEI
jgi:tRNA U34 2-thiouridine synthase MnmA/TrmU